MAEELQVPPTADKGGAPSARRRGGSDGRRWDRSDIAQISPVRGRSADGIADGGVDGQIEIRALRAERVIASDPQFVTALPPAVLPDDDARIKLVVQPG